MAVQFRYELRAVLLGGGDRLDGPAIGKDIKVGVSWFPGDQDYAPMERCERYHENIVH